jgi:transcriptional regulator with XRE-family HTH domain
MLTLTEQSPREAQLALAARAKRRRLELGLTQSGLAARAGLPLSTYRRFERTGEVSLRGLTCVALALGAVSDFDKVFAQPAYSSIQDVISPPKPKKRGSHA